MPRGPPFVPLAGPRPRRLWRLPSARSSTRLRPGHPRGSRYGCKRPASVELYSTMVVSRATATTGRTCADQPLCSASSSARRIDSKLREQRLRRETTLSSDHPPRTADRREQHREKHKIRFVIPHLSLQHVLISPRHPRARSRLCWKYSGRVASPAALWITTRNIPFHAAIRVCEALGQPVQPQFLEI